MKTPAIIYVLLPVFLALGGGMLAAEEAPFAGRLRAKIYAAAPMFVAPYTDQESRTAPLRDIRAHLRSKGIEIPAEGEATYDKENLTVTVRAPQAELDKLDALLASTLPRQDSTPAPFGKTQARIVFTLVEFEAGRVVEWHNFSVDQVRKAAGASWRVLDRTTFVGASGSKAMQEVAQKNGATGKIGRERAEPRQDGFTKDQYGAIVSAEPQVGPNGIVDLTLAYYYRQRASSGQPGFFFHLLSALSLQHGVPVIAHSVTLASPAGKAPAPAKELALIVQATRINNLGEPEESADPK